MNSKQIQRKYQSKILDWIEVTDPMELFLTGRYHITLRPPYSWDGTFSTSGTCRCFDNLRTAEHYLANVRPFR